MKKIASVAESGIAARTPYRWAALAAASVLLHLFVFNWADGRIGLPSFIQPGEPKVVVMTLNPEPPAVQALPAKPATALAPRKPRPARPTLTPPVETAALSETVEIEAPAAIVEAASVIEEALAEQGIVDILEQPEPSFTLHETATPYKVDLPPPVELKYEATALQRGQPVYGSGKIAWNPEAGRYSIVGEASVLFLTVLNFRSEGTLDASGIVPELYSEKPFRKSETNTHFHRERNTISFSASTLSYPRHGGEQDRSSVIWQLAGIGRGDATRFFTDAELKIFVAGGRDGEIWQVRVIGLEEIETSLGKTMAWHLARVSRTGSYDKKLDIWLAPQHEWYPVKLRYTDRNGDYLDLSLSKVVAAH